VAGIKKFYGESDNLKMINMLKQAELLLCLKNI
jgi:hypothetical protein